MTTAETVSRMPRNRPIWRRARSTTETSSNCFLLGLRQCREMLPLAHRGGQQLHIRPRRHAGDDGGDIGGLHGVASARGLHAGGGRGEGGLQRLRIGQRHEDRRIAARVQGILDEPDDAEPVPAQHDRIARAQARLRGRRAVRNGSCAMPRPSAILCGPPGRPGSKPMT